MLVLLSILEGQACPEVIKPWEGFFADFERVYSMPTTTKKEKNARELALRRIRLPQLLTSSFFGKLKD